MTDFLAVVRGERIGGPNCRLLGRIPNDRNASRCARIVIHEFGSRVGDKDAVKRRVEKRAWRVTRLWEIVRVQDYTLSSPSCHSRHADGSRFDERLSGIANHKASSRSQTFAIFLDRIRRYGLDRSLGANDALLVQSSVRGGSPKVGISKWLRHL